MISDSRSPISNLPSPTIRTSAWGLFSKKPRWSLSWRGWLLLVVLLTSVCALTIVRIHPFLAVTHREKTDVLVVEGWIHQSAMNQAAEEFKSGGYPRIYTTGGPVSGLGGYLSDYSTAASIGAGLLRKAGVPEESVQMVPAHATGRDRTYGSAVALRDWFREHNMTVKSINVMTEGAHARRTRLLFQTAFGKDVTVGIIAIPNADYDGNHWWHYSEGVREVIGESIAYLYAKFLFWP